MQNYKFNYSIIIPHKNSPELLAICLNSIPKRDDIQIIIIDDNSDNIDFDDFPGTGEKNINIYFTKEGKGAGYARNYGLEKALGRWVLFVDADDFLIENSFENVIDKYINSQADIVYFGATSIYLNTYQEANRHNYITSILNSYKEECLETHDYLKYNFVNPVCKLMRLDFIKGHKIKFDEVKYGNDVMFSIIAAYHSTKIEVIKTPIYCITYSQGTLVTKTNKESVYCRYIVNMRRNAFLKEIGKSQYQRSIIYSLFTAFKLSPLFCFRLFLLGIKNNANFLAGKDRWWNTTKSLIFRRK